MLRTAVDSDIPRIAENLRESDTIEVMRSHGHTPLEAVRYSFTVSTVCMTLVYKGRPVAIFGLCPDGPAAPLQATIWLLGTDGIRDIWRHFLKLSLEVVDWFHEVYPTLYNFVDAENVSSIRWLEWLGARFEEPKPYGAQGHPFRQFVLERKP